MTSAIQRAGLAALAVASVSLATWLLVEGAYSVYRWHSNGTSVAYGAVHSLQHLLRGRHAEEALAFPDVLYDARTLESLLDRMKASHVGLGNSPFAELRTAESAMTTERDGCLSLKPGLRKTTFFLRARLYNLLDPLTVFHDVDAALDPELRAFFDRYAVTPRVPLTTNGHGERVTVPVLERSRKVVIAGDSVAFGAMLGDEHTIASRWQALDPQRQYVSTGVPGADAKDALCNLEAAHRRYPGQIHEVVYVYCENDFKPNRDYGDPESVVRWLAGFATREGIPRVTVVYAPYVYNVVPHLTRFSGYRGAEMPTYRREKALLDAAVRDAGFRWLDIGELAVEDDRHFGTQFAALHFFVDHVHPSVYGVERIVERLANQPAGPKAEHTPPPTSDMQ